jgi:LuxR family quorum sensing-dependent transcriptional regulator
MGDLRHALDFIERAAAAGDCGALQRVITDTLQQFGIHHFTMGALVDQENGARLPVALARPSPPDWWAYYAERRYFNFDPVVHAIITKPGAFTWEDLDSRSFSSVAKGVFAEGSGALESDTSLVIPTHDARGVAGFVAFFFPDRGPDEGMRRALKLIAVYALERAKELQGIGSSPAGSIQVCPLTPRQREVLTFMAMGKTDWEIGAILGIAEKTANQHIEDAKKRINVATRAQAAAVAVHRGWVAL